MKPQHTCLPERCLLPKSWRCRRSAESDCRRGRARAASCRCRCANCWRSSSKGAGSLEGLPEGTSDAMKANCCCGSS